MEHKIILLKQIDKSENPVKVIEDNISHFLDEMIIYLENISRKAKKRKLRKKNDSTYFEKVIKYLNLLVTLPQLKSIKGSDFLKLNMIFSILFHPHTKSNSRTLFLNAFKYILEMFGSNNVFKYFETSIFCMIPYNHFMKNSANISDFEKLGNGVIEIITNEEYDDDAILILFKQFISFLLSKWCDNPEFFSKMFYSIILRVLYPKIAETSGFEPLKYGFRDEEPPQAIVKIVFSFLSDFVKENIDLNTLIPTITHLKFIIGIFEIFFNNETNIIQNISLYFNFLKKCISCSLIIQNLHNDELDLFLKINDCLCSSIENISDLTDEITENFYSYFSLFFKILFENVKPERSINEINEIFCKYHYEKKSSIITMFSFLDFIFKTKDIPTNILECLLNISVESDLLSAASCKYIQYMALVIFKDMFHVDENEIIDVSNKIEIKKKRNHMKSQYDYITTNIRMILNSPDVFIKTKVKMFWKPHKEFDDVFEAIKIPIFKNDNGIDLLEKTNDFLNLFQTYSKLDSTRKKQAAFSVVGTFLNMIVLLRNIPPTVKYNRVAIYKYLNIIFQATLSQNNYLIRKSAFNILCSVLDYNDLKNIVDSETLFQIYLCIGLMIFSKKEKYVEMAFNIAFKFIKAGFTGSTMFIPILINVIKANMVKFNHMLSGFLSSFPLFKIDVSQNSLFINKLREIIEKIGKTNFNPNYEELLKPTINNYDFIINYIEKLPNEWNLILPIYSILLSYEITNQTDDPSTIKKIFDKFLSAVNELNYNALLVINSITIYFESIMLKFKSLYSNFIEKLINVQTYITNDTDVKFVFQYIMMINKLLIISYESSSYCTKIYLKYIDFLRKASSTFKSIEIISLAENSIVYLGLFIKKYPFHSSIFFPMSTDNSICINGENNIHAINNGNIFKVDIDEEEKIHFLTLINGGHYKWIFKSLDSDFFSPYNIKSNFTNHSYDISNIKNSDNLNNSKFLKDIDALYNQFEDVSNNFNVNITNDDVLSKIQDNIQFTTSQKTNILKTNSFFDNPSASLISSLGLSEPNNNLIFPIKNEKRALFELKQQLYLTQRNCFKVGVIYVGENIYNQNDILSTELNETTPEFREFLTGLGWPVKLKFHASFNGGLDVYDLKNGETSIFYSDFSTELMFHVSTLMPKDIEDSQQILKKKHIGNDRVNIIWSDNKDDFSISTITSQFHQVHIIIYPIEFCLFRVEVFWRDDVEFFSPLRFPIICSKKVLPSLVRSTAISAITSIYQSKTQFYYPLLSNNDSLSSIVCKYNVYKDHLSKETESLQKLMVDTKRETPVTSDITAIHRSFSSSTNLKLIELKE